MKLKLIPFFALIVSSAIYANEKSETEYKTMEQMIGSIRLEKKQIESMINKMIASGRLSPEEGSKAKREVASVKETDMEDLKKLAIAEVRNKKLNP